MSTNTRKILSTILAAERNRLGPALDDSDLFEIFTAEQLLKDFDLSYDEIERGITGGTNDGGVDSIYAFVDDDLITDDTDTSDYKTDVTIQLFLIQSKVSASFDVSAIEKLGSFTRDLLDLSTDLDEFTEVYNSNVLSGIDAFRKIYLALSHRFPSLLVSYIYASQGSDIHPTVRWKAEQLRERTRQMFAHSPCTVDFQFLTAARLLDLARRSPAVPRGLKLLQTPISASKADKNGYLCLVRLKDYFEFITTPSGTINKAMFEVNVRDYQGRTTVNEQIAATLFGEPTEDFWWLNNGVTILASRGSIIGNTLTIEDPQIVNGLQTSTEVHNYLAREQDADDDRNILVRVIVSDEETSRDRIIRATNSQTSMLAASLRATDTLQRDIESYFQATDLYYDRRKNYYKNLGKPSNKIITISNLAQAVTAIVLREPDNARARPASLLKDDITYRKIFDPNYPIELFLTCAKTMRLISDFLRTRKGQPEPITRLNIQFHLATFATYRLLGRSSARPEQLQALELDDMNSEFLRECYDEVRALFEQLRQPDNDSYDKIAKSPKSTQVLQARLEQVATVR